MVKKYKKNLNCSYTLGMTITIELLKERLEFVERVFVHSKIIKNDVFNDLEKQCLKNNIPIIYNDKVFNVLSDKENCFVIGEFKKYETGLNRNSNHLVLVNPSNAGNLGTIMRTMTGFNFSDLVIISPGVDSFDPKTIRASMGAVFHLNIKYYNSFNDYLKEYKRMVYPLMLEAETLVAEVVEEEPYSLVFGNEATGLDSEYLNKGIPLVIKHSSNIDSLNLPIAVSITLYELTKKKHF